MSNGNDIDKYIKNLATQVKQTWIQESQDIQYEEDKQQYQYILNSQILKSNTLIEAPISVYKPNDKYKIDEIIKYCTALYSLSGSQQDQDIAQTLLQTQKLNEILPQYAILRLFKNVNNNIKQRKINMPQSKINYNCWSLESINQTKNHFTLEIKRSQNLLEILGFIKESLDSCYQQTERYQRKSLKHPIISQQIQQSHEQDQELTIRLLNQENKQNTSNSLKLIQEKYDKVDMIQDLQPRLNNVQQQLTQQNQYQSQEPNQKSIQLFKQKTTKHKRNQISRLGSPLLHKNGELYVNQIMQIMIDDSNTQNQPVSQQLLQETQIEMEKQDNLEKEQRQPQPLDNDSINLALLNQCNLPKILAPSLDSAQDYLQNKFNTQDSQQQPIIQNGLYQNKQNQDKSDFNQLIQPSVTQPCEKDLILKNINTSSLPQFVQSQEYESQTKVSISSEISDGKVNLKTLTIQEKKEIKTLILSNIIDIEAIILAYQHVKQQEVLDFIENFKQFKNKLEKLTTTIYKKL
ncbi:hypothetical protein SS50377_20333 [Spironucleus salmonicida]|uniref:Uncharacterized protein n=1 Tax=Spironucleus salmonicida TaxID=348837 RepID=V6LQI0_9EUKA|nr:hypothetical protein SS50377_20333 [Spironucleus salmonicida]|eukprot:EST43014.1 Hypothetical protein SS50377_17315 [Spironucleus salmonicida]